LLVVERPQKHKKGKTMSQNPSEHLLYYWLSLCRVTPLRMQKLLEIYSVSELFARIKRDVKIGELLGADKYQALCGTADEETLQKSYDGLYRHGVQFLAYGDEAFPEALRQREVLPPPGL
jgi:predicted Rossmann fold nucleotide-binding protein DprA/Smf involved in DNA uptake